MDSLHLKAKDALAKLDDSLKKLTADFCEVVHTSWKNKISDDKVIDQRDTSCSLINKEKLDTPVKGPINLGIE